MEIELYPILSTVILASTVMTIVFAIFSYILFRLRESKAAKRRLQTPAEEAIAEAAHTSEQVVPVPASTSPDDFRPVAAAPEHVPAENAFRRSGAPRPRLFRRYEPAR